MRPHLCAPKALIVFALVAALGTSASAQKRTPLLEVDMEKGKATFRIDPNAKAEDNELDFLGITRKGFTTKELDGIEQTLRRSVRTVRPRATPRLLLFLHPGRISASRLFNEDEVIIDLRLDIDPCPRTVCRDAVAKTIHLLGKAIGEARQDKESYTVVFREITIKALTEYRGKQATVYRFSAERCVEMGESFASAKAMIDGHHREEEQYEALMTRAISQNAKTRRLRLVGAPDVRRHEGSVTASLTVKSSRNRFQSDVQSALTAAAKALRKSRVTPPDYSIEVAAKVKFRETKTQRYRAPGSAVNRFLDGEFDASTLWSMYVIEQDRSGAAELDMSANDGKPGPASTAPSEAEVAAVVAGNFSGISECVGAELQRTPTLSGVTITFTLNPSGKATKVGVKESRKVSKKLAGCLGRAFKRIGFPRFRGLPRGVEYPVFVQGG